MQNRKIEIEKIQKEIAETNERILKQKQSKASQSSARDQLIKNAGNATPSIDAELVQEIDEEVKMLRLDFNKINSQVQSLVRNANASTRTAPDTSGYATVDNAALSKLDHKLMKAVQESSMNVTEVKKQIEDMQEMVSRNQNFIKVS